MKNEYFKLVKIHNNNKDDFEILTCIRKYDDRDIWKDISNTFLNTIEYISESHKDPYGSIYHLDLKHILNIIAPDIINKFKLFIIDNNINLNKNDIAIYLASSNDYAKFNEQFDNEMKFLEYINSEYSEMDKHRDITEDILKDAGFEYLEKESNICKDYEKNTYGIENYKVFRKWTEDKQPIKLDIDNGFNNRGTKWHIHIDNDTCETIGCADIDTVWEFNSLMQIFKSKFRI